MFEFTTVFIIDIIRKICPPHFSASYYLNFISIGTELCMHLVWYCQDYFLCKVSIIMIIDGTNIWLYFRRQYVLKYYIQLFDKQVVQLKPHEFGEVLSKLEQFFPSQNLFWKVKFAIKSIYLAGDIEGFFLSWLYKCCDALYAWTTKETWLVIIYLLLTRLWIPMQKAQCDPYAHPGVYSPSNSNIYIN